MRPHVVFLLLAAVAACSVLNREGPDVTCTDLDNGAKNACSDGIIATCAAGEVRWQVCDARDACEQSWQVDGRFRCADSDPVPGGAGGSGGSGGTATGGSGGSAPAVAVCGTCPTGYSMAANACNKECGDCGCFQKLCVQQGVAVQLAQGTCPPGQHSVLTVPDCPAGCANCGERLLCVTD